MLPLTQNTNLDIETITVFDYSSLWVLILIAGVGTVVSLIIFSASRRWVGLLFGWIILLSTLGFLGYQSHALLTSTQTEETKSANSQNVIDWASTRYGIQVDELQARTLIGAAETPFVGKGKFGTIKYQLPKQEAGNQSIGKVTLLYDGTEWKLAIFQNNSESWREVDPVGSSN